jgi:hypothetical protein
MWNEGSLYIIIDSSIILEKLILYKYFAWPPHNYLVEGYVKYIWYVKKNKILSLILLCSIIVSPSFLTTSSTRTKK